MTQTTPFICTVTLIGVIMAPTIIPTGGSFWGSISVMVKTATSGADNPRSNTIASFTVSQTASITKGVIRYVDGNLPSSCTRGNYSIANRNCTGSDGDAYVSLQAASNASAPGDTVLIRGFNGVYTGSMLFGNILPKEGTSVNNRTLYQGYQNENPVTRGFGHGDRHTRFFILKNLVIDHGNQADSYMGNISFVRLENLEIKNGGSHGILGIGSSELINLNVHHNGFNSQQCRAHPTQCHGAYTGPNRSSDIHGNFNVFDGGRYHHNEGYGIHCYSHCAGTTIRNLRADHNLSSGIIVTAGGDSVVHDVVADNNRALGLLLLNERLLVYKLTVVNNGAGSIELRTDLNWRMIVKDSIVIGNGGGNSISGCGSAGNVCSNNVTVGAVADLFVDAANGIFQRKPTSKVKGIGADLPIPRY